MQHYINTVTFEKYLGVLPLDFIFKYDDDGNPWLGIENIYSPATVTDEELAAAQTAYTTRADAENYGGEYTARATITRIVAD